MLFVSDRFGQMMYAFFFLSYFSDEIREVEQILTLSSLIVPLVDIGLRPSYLSERYSLTRAKTVILLLLFIQILLVVISALFVNHSIVKATWVFSRALNVAFIQFIFVAMRFEKIATFWLFWSMLIALASALPFIIFGIEFGGLLASITMITVSSILVIKTIPNKLSFSTIKSTFKFNLFRGFPIIANIFIVTVSLNSIRLSQDIDLGDLISLGYIQRVSVILPFVASILVNLSLSRSAELIKQDLLMPYLNKIVSRYLFLGLFLIFGSTLIFNKILDVGAFYTVALMMPFLILGVASIFEMTLNLAGKQKSVLTSGLLALIIALFSFRLVDPHISVNVFSFNYFLFMYLFMRNNLRVTS